MQKLDSERFKQLEPLMHQLLPVRTYSFTERAMMALGCYPDKVPPGTPDDMKKVLLKPLLKKL